MDSPLLHSLYYAEACNELASPSPRLSAKDQDKKAICESAKTVAKRWSRKILEKQWELCKIWPVWDLNSRSGHDARTLTIQSLIDWKLYLYHFGKYIFILNAKSYLYQYTKRFIHLCDLIGLWRRRSSVVRGTGLVIWRLRNLGSTPDAVARRCVLGKERYLMLFSTLGPSSLPVVVAQPDERHANRTASMLEWYMTDTQHVTSDLNKAAESVHSICILCTITRFEIAMYPKQFH